MSMWNIEDLPEMTLQPCCYQNTMGRNRWKTKLHVNSAFT